MIHYNGEQYLTATEVAQRFTLSRATCYTNILPHMPKCFLPGRKHAHYRLLDVEQFSEVRIEVHRSKIPASAEEAETGSIVQ